MPDARHCHREARREPGDIGHAIQTYAEAERCSVVRDFCGHGLGRVFHDHPNVLHYGRLGEGVELKAGMFFTIEPMINLGRPHVKILSDGWTAVTRDRSLSAQFEHTVGVTDTAVRFSPYRRADSISRPTRCRSMTKGLDEAVLEPHSRPSRASARALPRKRPDALPDYELLELVLFRAIKRGDTKPLAKTLIADSATSPRS